MRMLNMPGDEDASKKIQKLEKNMKINYAEFYGVHTGESDLSGAIKCSLKNDIKHLDEYVKTTKKIMNKICTSIEQSKKLIELGIDVETGDLWYIPIKVNGVSGYELTLNSSLTRGIVPAWSLSALFDLLPEHTQVPSSLKQNKYMCNYHNGIVEFGDDCQKEKSTNLFDAVFEMICWLKENGKI